MVKYTIVMNRDEEGFGIKNITFEVPEDMYALVGDILTGKIAVRPPEAPAEATPTEDAPVEAAPAKE